jgi:probable rRNA maturation factor
VNTDALEFVFEAGDDLSPQEQTLLVSQSDISAWLTQALLHISYQHRVELTIRAVSRAESQTLNRDYRNQDKPTNVLSFVNETPDFVESDYIGDIVICVDVLAQEAKAQDKTIEQHWAHLCVHGLLHLLGYDHINEKDAREMEGIETSVLASLGIDDPYQDR